MTKITLGIFLCLPIVVFGILRTYNSEIYDIRCGEHIDRAAHANAVATAKSELGAAIEYLERNKMTSGYTSILYTSPLEDVGYWYQNLKAGKAELEALPAMSTPLEQSNVLMRIRESLSKTPDGISIFPDNVFYCWFAWIAAIAFCVGCWLFMANRLI